jgi:hypothetical protein
MRTSCGWCATDAKPTDSTTICPDCLERHFHEPKLLPAWASKREVPLPGVFESKSEAAKAVSAVGVFYAVLLLVAYLSVEVAMAWVLP